MIYAIAMTDNKLSHQFSKSETFTFYNEENQVLGTYKNPALSSSGCSAKHAIVDLLQKMQCDLVIVRKIGEKTLAKLLRAGLKVELGNTRNNIEQLLESAKAFNHSLTKPEQGIQKIANKKVMLINVVVNIDRIIDLFFCVFISDYFNGFERYFWP